MHAEVSGNFSRSWARMLSSPTRPSFSSTNATLFLSSSTSRTSWFSRRTQSRFPQVVKLANEYSIPFLPRGSGTGLSGGALAAEGGIIIEMQRMNKILSIDVENRIAVVQPGVVNLHITQAAAPLGLYYAPDPSSQMACSIGGNVAENSGGPHCLKYGMTTNHILEIEAVLSDGEIVRLGQSRGRGRRPGSCRGDRRIRRNVRHRDGNSRFGFFQSRRP